MLSALKNLSGSVPRVAEKLTRNLRRSTEARPISLGAKSPELSDDVASDSRTPAVALVLVVDPTAKLASALERDLGAEVDTIDPLHLDKTIPQNAQAAVRTILDVLKVRLANGSSVTVIPVDLNLSLRSRYAQPILEFPGLTIDRARREVQTDAGLTLLTKGEFDLLTFLAESPGVVFSRPELVDHCRGGDHFLDYRAIDVQIFGLRKKLGSVNWHIQTVRGFGYRFVIDPPEHAEVNLRPR